ncbi:MAG: tRNA guanosine(34) transglycosylase Tgt [Planctomycetes bacterium]|nr:tRNA guanosine(34) transglycosylase Tgt [Planctomycetota bacterium]
MSEFSFKLEATDEAARAGRILTTRGEIPTPIFMPVGTQATVKSMLPDQLENAGAKIILGNTYHLHLRPGDELIRNQGGLHEFMSWRGPILTDSGGFQVYSLGEKVRITDEGAAFQSHIDGSRVFISPEDAVRIQRNLGSDVQMVFDECVKLPSEKERVRDAMERTHRWAVRCKAEFEREPPHGAAQFAIVQGGVHEDLRRESAEFLRALDFPGYAIGGLSVGEDQKAMLQTLEAVAVHLPVEKPRYLMGVGTPRDIVEAIHRGVDMFDCVLPTRNARHAQAFTSEGTMSLKTLQFREDKRPLDEKCSCVACAKFSRAYIRHLVVAGEILASILLTIHNVSYYLDLTRKARESIVGGTWDIFRKNFTSA